MKRNLAWLSQRYMAALRKQLKQNQRASLQPARELGHQAMSIRLGTLELARIHDQALIALAPTYSTGTRVTMMKRAGRFFAEAITPIEKTHRTAQEANIHLNHLIKTLGRRSADLAFSNLQLKQEILQRQGAEESLRKSERHYGKLLVQSREMQEQLRHLSHQLLSAQEEERKKISRELHDEIAQTLTGINVQLANLKKEATVSVKGLQRKIARTQRLVEKSVDIVHRFARELRPTVLDDLGLIPALHSFVKSFAKRTGIHIHLTVSSKVEQLDGAKRTVLYRVAQEALTNVARHAQASQAEVIIQKLPGAVRMEIKDNGKSFQVQRVLRAKGNNRLGLLGMRERVEMVGGGFSVSSTPGKGTSIRAQIPFNNGKKGWHS